MRNISKTILFKKLKKCHPFKVNLIDNVDEKENLFFGKNFHIN